jgi:anti-sigma B factor antagonist
VTLLARVIEERQDDIAIAVVEGEVDASNTPEIGDRLRLLLTNQSHVLIADLTPTTYIDSAGINVLFRLGTELEERQQQLHLVVASPSPIARMVTIVGLDSQVPTFSTREAAVAELDRGP